MRTFPFGLSYLISPGRSESPGVTLDLLAAARRSASQPMKARASTTTMKILRKVSITLFAVDSAPRDTSTGLVHLKPSAALFHAAWKVGCWQFPFTNDLGGDYPALT